MMARSTPGSPMCAASPSCAQNGIATKKAPNAVIMPTTAEIPISTRPLASSTRIRSGTAVNVTLMPPVEYSLHTISTPSTPIASWPRIRPPIAKLVGSGLIRSCGVRWVVWPQEASAASPMVSVTRAISVQNVERSDHTLVHSDRIT